MRKLQQQATHGPLHWVPEPVGRNNSALHRCPPNRMLGAVAMLARQYIEPLCSFTHNLCLKVQGGPLCFYWSNCPFGSRLWHATIIPCKWVCCHQCWKALPLAFPSGRPCMFSMTWFLIVAKSPNCITIVHTFSSQIQQRAKDKLL